MLRLPKKYRGNSPDRQTPSMMAGGTGQSAPQKVCNCHPAYAPKGMKAAKATTHSHSIRGLASGRLSTGRYSAGFKSISDMSRKVSAPSPSRKPASEVA